MSIQIGEYNFEGPHSNTASLLDASGIYAILTHNGSQYVVLDIGESATVKSRIESHDRKACWEQNAKSGLYVAVHHTPNKQQAGRKEIEQALRAQYTPTCGDR